VELQQVERVRAQVRQAALDERGQVLAVVPRGHVRAQPTPGLGRHHDLFRSLGPQPRHQPLRAAVAVHVGGVDEVDALVHRAVQRAQRLGVVGAAPGVAADGPGAEADRGDAEGGATQRAVLHACPQSSGRTSIFR
jgi:hypothetical protein